ncbi:TRAP-type C4-dicarboxylate transport system, substrate-binding protein [Roseovarius azorensis]|uniref:TRAP-type C4-dicarboxylate transport system, substrate-binding protein n=1 Tax=Roseovarius azorensis TaxID=1287727 RepID=A0A1H7N8V4_9RHOB|nr:TRAP transporter substrate-binding protein [Roseovarius azorensis]SEL19904.1 TRAP-type C4-dicarboxylate transport system, substrate-binding protein [Roseovarius azorensis]
MKLLNIMSTAALGIVLALPAGAQDYKLKLHHFLSERAPAHSKMLVPWAERVEELSGGAVDIEVYPAMTLGGRPPELVQQARDGVVDLVWTLNGYTSGLFPRSEVFELANVYVNDPVATNLAMREMFEAELAQEYEGLEVMFLHVHAGNGFQMVDKEVRAPADLAGLRLRTPSRTGAWVIEALGATPVAMPVPDLPQALAKGVIDGALIPWEIIPPLRLQEQTDFQIEGAAKERMGTSVFQVSMTKATWDSLPETVQAAFREASNEDWLREVGELWRGTDEFGINMAVEAGNTHVVLTEAETAVMLEATTGVVDRWIEEVSAKGIDGAGLVEAARAAIARHAQ